MAFTGISPNTLCRQLLSFLGHCECEMSLAVPHLGFWELPPRCHVLDHPCLCWALVLWVCQWISFHFFPVGSLLNPVGFVYKLCSVPHPLEFSSREWLWADTKSGGSGGHVGKKSDFKPDERQPFSSVNLLFLRQCPGEVNKQNQTQAQGSGLLRKCIL